MKLTEEQIQKIDILLKTKGIQYWDLRIEMIDHIVSDIEVNATSTNFQVEFQKSLKRIGWDNNLQNINKKGWKEVNNLYRREFGVIFLDFFKSVRKIIFLVVSFCFFYSISQTVIFKLFKTINIILFIVPIIIFLGFSTWTYVKKYGKSVHVNYGIFYFSISFLTMNIIVQFMSYFSEKTQIIIWLFLTPIYLIGMYSGYVIFKKTINIVQNIKQQLAL